jgi:alpha-ketoglutarate-dependent taurine dioxygenase
MHISLHKNGWTGILEDFDFATATQEEINQIGKFLASNTLIIAKNQGHLTIKDECKIAHMFGNVENMDAVAHEKPWNYLLLPDSNNEVMRVTGELDEHGQPGLFGHVSELDWHCNKPAVPVRMPLVWLLGIKGTAGSRTSWINNIISYQDLDNDMKEEIKDAKMVCGWKKGNYSEFDFSDGTREEDFNEYYTPSIVHKNVGDQTGLFFPFLQFRNFVGMNQEQSIVLANKLKNHILQEKYMYHHEWDDGDVIIHEQCLGLHKRWEFDGMPTRVLHRLTYDFANIKM